MTRTPQPTEGETKEKLHCNTCNRSTNHRILKSERNVKDDCDENGRALWYEITEAQLLQCCGCDDFCLRIITEGCEYGPVPVVEIYPTRHTWVTRGLSAGSRIHEIPNPVAAVYGETLTAVHAGSTILAGLGIRSIVESICLAKEISGNNLEEKINGLSTAGVTTQTGAEILHGIRRMGNAAVHDLIAPTREQIMVALQVIDHMLLGAFILPNAAHRALLLSQEP